MSITSDSPFLARTAQPVPDEGPGAAWHRIDGAFDTATALELGDRLARRGLRDERHLDFSRASRIEDRGLAALAALITSAQIGPQVFFHGLSRHQIRLLAYFGVDADRGGASLIQ